jgi:hypothetical protein
MHVEQINQRYFLPTENHIDPPAVFDTCRTSLDDAIQHMRGTGTPVLLGKLNSGQLIWNFQGHANQYLLTHENIFVNQSTDTGDELRLRNDGMSFIFTAFSCHANTFAHPEQHGLAGGGPGLGEDLLALPSGRGAVASWASVCFEVVPANDHDHINVELMRDLFVNTPRDEFLGTDDRGSRAVIGEVILTSLITYLATVQAKPSERGLGVSYTLLGDPATRISIAQPNALVLANGIPVTSGEALRLHTPGNTLRIDANVVSIVRIDSLALFVNSGSGDVPVPPADYSITPPLPDTAASTGFFGGRHFKIVYITQPRPESATYSIVARDRKGLVQRTDIKLQLVGLLRSGGNQINDYDEVPASAALSLELRSPAPIANPLAEISLKINGVVQPFTATPNSGDASGREWILAWSHADYPIDDYVVVASVQNGGSVTRVFRVTASASRLAIKDLIPFPNPFDNGGTHFSFLLTGTEPADVKVHVFSLAGRSIYTGVVRGLAPGYHQLAWDGRDAEGDELGNGVYFYRVSVTTAGGATTQQLGRLVKLRRPRHVDETTAP